MDAQNASEATSTKPNASSTASSSRVPDSQRQKSSSTSSAASVNRSPTLSRAVPPSSRDPKSSTKPGISSSSSSNKDRSRSSNTRTASPTSTRDGKATASSSRDKQDDDGGTDGNSEAETIVLSKDGSPSKPRSRKVIKHEDKDKPNGTSASSADQGLTSRRQAADKKDGSAEKRDKGDKAGDAADGSAVTQPKKKRLHDRLQPGSARSKDTSSSLSSAPASPPRSRNTSSRPHSGSDSEHDRNQRTKSPKRSSSTASKDRLRPPEKLVPHKRKAPKVESDDETEVHSARRLRLASAGAGGDGTSHSSSRSSGKDSSRNSLGSNGNANGKASARGNRDTSQNRSVSPQARSHRRSLSTQLQSQPSGLGLKKKRVPAPLQSTDYNSDDSTASGSPHIRGVKGRSLATPATAESATSPAKTSTNKKHLDAHGQTLLARACARGEVELAKQRLKERPNDLNTADFAGNTPLQIAALNGYGDIVKLLINAGCQLDCVNRDKDTPLLDAVDNGHLDVVKLLLDAGVNPRKANVNGEEPLDRATEEIDNCEEIRAALIEAKKNVGRRFTSEEHRHETDDARNSHQPESPQRSPAPTSRRAGTLRATKTSNHLLYMPMDDKTLRLAAGRGDEENVMRILNVRESCDDPESMVAASRGGHDVILQLLLALGQANPDPEPIPNAPAEHATPILAAIGQENIKIISLLLDQASFDPTKRYNGQTYYEIARERQGPNWQDEEDMLKKAYDKYKKLHNGRSKDSESRRSRASEVADETPRSSQKRKNASPSQERPKKATTGTKVGTTTTSGMASAARDEKGSQKRSSDQKASTASTAKSRQRSERSPSASITNRDTPPPSKQSTKSKKLDSDSIAVSSEGETAKPRRKKLISGRELKDEKVREKEREREKQRRASIASSKAPTPPKGSSSPRPDDSATDKEKPRTEKIRDRDRDRTRQLKKEGSKDAAPGVAGEGSIKRNRLSETPPNASVSDKDFNEAPIKRRKLEVDNGTGKERRLSKGSAPPDDIPTKTPAASKPSNQKRRDDDERKSSSATKTKKRDPSSDRGRQDSSKQSVSPVEKSIHVKSEDIDVEMADVSSERRSSGASTAAEADVARQKDEDKKKKAEAKSQAQAAEAKKKDEEAQRRRRQEEEDEKRQKEEKRKKEEEKRKREEAEEEARLKEEAEKKELEEKKKREEEEKQKQRKKLEDEERRRKEEERKRKEEEEKKKLEEEAEKKRRQEEEERKRKLEEEERKKREEEERLRREQLEKEAAEEARRKLEEQERKRREQERLLAEQKAAEELRRRQDEEKERARISKLPPALQWLSLCPDPKQSVTAYLFRTMQGLRYDCIDAAANGTEEGREQWLLNTQAALVLGEKDLTLARFSAWPRQPASEAAKLAIWRLERDRYALTDPTFYDLGRQIPGYYGAQDPTELGSLDLEDLCLAAWEKYAATDMFFVKVSDFMDAVSRAPHLRGMQLAVMYRELPVDMAKPMVLPKKWKTDPNAEDYHGFAPGAKYYRDGIFTHQKTAGIDRKRKAPPPALPVPRDGLRALAADDPEFASRSRALGVDPMNHPAYAALVRRQQQNGIVSPDGTELGHVNGTTRVNGTNGTGPEHFASLPVHSANGTNGARRS